MTLESITFYKGELTPEQIKECRKLAYRESTRIEAIRRRIPREELFDRNSVYFLWQSYRAKLYRRFKK